MSTITSREEEQRKIAKERLQAAIVPISATIAETLPHMQHEAALIVDEEGILCGIVTDGDLRRAFLKGASPQTPVAEIMTRHPVTVTPETSREVVRRIMFRQKIRHIPVVDSQYRPVALECLKDQLPDEPPDAVIMAGGLGSRLAPLTYDTPKPLLPLGDSTILDTILNRLRQSDIQEVVLSVNYLREKIKNHVGTGEQHGIHVRYVDEEKKMGTAGSLSLLSPPPTQSFLVMNGDLVTELNFRQFIDFHRRNHYTITVAVRRETITVPYGVIDLDQSCQLIKQIREKPQLSVLVSAGIYMLEPCVLSLIPPNTYFDMPELIQKSIENGYTVGAFPILEYWRDIGRHEEMEQAKREWQHRSHQRNESPILGSVPTYLHET